MITIAVGPNVNKNKLHTIASYFRSRNEYHMEDWDDMTILADKLFETKKSKYRSLTLRVLVTTIDALQHFGTG